MRRRHKEHVPSGTRMPAPAPTSGRLRPRRAFAWALWRFPSRPYDSAFQSDESSVLIGMQIEGVRRLARECDETPGFMIEHVVLVAELRERACHAMPVAVLDQKDWSPPANGLLEAKDHLALRALDVDLDQLRRDAQ